MKKSAGGFALNVLWLWFALLPGAAAAHPAQFTTLQVTVDPTGQFRATLNIDVLSFALGKPSIEASNEELEALLNGPRATLAQALADAAERFRREVVVRTNAGDASVVTWRSPGLADVDEVLGRKIQPRILIGGEITFAGRLPAGAGNISIRLPYVVGKTVHVYVVPGGDGEGQLVPAGEYAGVVKFERHSTRAD